MMVIGNKKLWIGNLLNLLRIVTEEDNGPFSFTKYVLCYKTKRYSKSAGREKEQT